MTYEIQKLSGLYVYLLSRPPAWKLNIKHLAEHFQCGPQRLYRILNYLLEHKYISKTIIKNKGKFVTHHYRYILVNLVDLHHLWEILQVEKPHTYKTKKVLNKEDLKTPIVDSANTTTECKKEYKHDPLFMEFYKNYPNKQNPVIAYKAFVKLKPTEEFVSMLIQDVITRANNNWKGRDIASSVLYSVTKP